MIMLQTYGLLGLRSAALDSHSSSSKLLKYLKFELI
jgi:hypothetical protein